MSYPTDCLTMTSFALLYYAGSFHCRKCVHRLADISLSILPHIRPGTFQSSSCWTLWKEKEEEEGTVEISVTRLGELLDFGQLFKTRSRKIEFKSLTYTPSR